jgi:hypothetical protein
MDNVTAVLELLPPAIDRVADRTIREGLNADIIGRLADAIRQRVARCMEIMNAPAAV